MKKLIAIAAITAATTAGAQTLTNLELGLTGGYANGLSGEVFIHAPNVLGPVGVKVGASYTKASDAINDSSDLGAGPFSGYKTAGATENGSHTVISLDGTYGLGELAPGIDATLYAGGRYGMFSATEDYGSGVYTTYTSNAFGIGGGAMIGYALTGNLSLVGDLGLDYYFKNSINQTQHTATGVTENTTYATSDTNYPGVDNRFVRPGTVFKAKIGIKYTF